MNNKLKVLITGDRAWDNLESIYQELSQFNPDETIIIHGDALGADRQARVIAEEMGFEVKHYPAHWRHNGGEYVAVFGRCPADCKEMVGRPAGVIRNQKMLNLKPDRVLAFHRDLAKSKGTKDMVTRAKKAGIPVKLISKYS